MSRKRILFVDDEPLVLQGLQRMLRGLRNEYDLEFVDSGAKGLERLSQMPPIDIVVSDMRMPHMDGAQFLNEVMTRHPETIRLVLSGHADQELIARCVDSAHQFLTKPCEPEFLKSTLQKASELRDRLLSDRIQQAVGKIEHLPSLPQVYQALTEALQKESTTVKDLGTIIGQDVGMTAKILKLVNSAFFGLRRSISSPEEAVSFLGVETIRSLVLVNSIFNQVGKLKTRQLQLDVLWSHCLRVGQGAALLSRLEKRDKAFQDASFVGGLLHDVGLLVLAQNLPESVDEAAESSIKDHKPYIQTELQIFGLTHAEVGAYLLGLWGLPEPIIQAVRWHGRLTQHPDPGFSTAMAVHVADAMEAQAHTPRLFWPSEVDEEYLRHLGLEARLNAWKTSLAQVAQE